MKKFLFIFIILFFCFTSLASKAFAASIIVSAPPDIKVGDTFEVGISVDTGGEMINSLDIALAYPKDFISFAGYKNENTVVSIWIETPSEKDGEIHMSGIIPGGVLGLYDPNKQGLGDIPLTRLLFIAKGAGTGQLSFVKSVILKNDGKGTELAHDQKDASITINSIENKNPDNGEKIADKNLPEPFDITFVDSSFFSNTPPMLIFQANDIGSGIKQYQIKTGASSWQDAKSPQPISKGIFPQDITIRAFNFSGNARDAEISIPGLVSSEFLWIFFTLILGGILGYKLLKYKL